MTTVRCALLSCLCNSLSSLNLVVDSTTKIVYIHDISSKLFSVFKIEKKNIICWFYIVWGVFELSKTKTNPIITYQLHFLSLANLKPQPIFFDTQLKRTLSGKE